MSQRAAAPNRLQGYQLLHEGTLTLSRMEHNGIKIDTSYLERAKQEVSMKIQTLTDKIRASREFYYWSMRYGSDTNLNSIKQLEQVLTKDLGLTIKEKTDKGAPKLDESALKDFGLSFLFDFIECKKLKKLMTTYLEGISREIQDGYLHPNFLLNTVQTFRSCIAKGTLVETVRDVSLHPKGIPIEDVRAGDFVYCYDDKKSLTIRKVLWAGKTGTRKVIRLHWSARGKRGYLDLTPEHEVRLASGRYVQAKTLKNADFRKLEGRNKHDAKVRTLAMGRRGDMLYQTNQIDPVLDHRLVYQCLVGDLSSESVVHHKDRNHLNNVPSNLEKHTNVTHARLHAPEVLTPENIKKGNDIVRQMYARGEVKLRKGAECHNWHNLSKVQIFRMLLSSGGTIKHLEYDFTVMKSRFALFNIDHKAIKDRFDRNGCYITRGRLLRAIAKGFTSARLEFGVNFYKLKRLYVQRGIPFQRKWGNQFGEFVPNNHRIDRVEEIDRVVDVYDIEVEEHHNFIANEICVHNSSASPNFQNIPVRNKILSEYIRRCFIPRKNRRLVEIDFSGIEVRIAACYHKDPTMLEYIKDKSKDMHRDMAQECYMLSCPKDVNKDSRYCAKNQFVFPQFYGSTYVNCARALWESLTKMNLKVGSTEKKVSEHLREKGITQLGKCDREKEPVQGTFEHHIKEVQERFWLKRFPVYTQWKYDWHDAYRANGYFDLITGFRCKGLFSKNEVINYPVQSAAFHCLLWSIIEIQKWLDKRKMKSRLVGQIHDSLIADVVEEELQDFLNYCHKTMTIRLLNHWQWINVPLEVEVDVTPVNGSWHEKALWEKDGGQWRLTKKK